MTMEHIERPPSHMMFETLLASPSSDDELVAMFTRLNASVADYVKGCMSSKFGPQLLVPETTSSQALDDILRPESPMGLKKLSDLLQNDRTRAASLRHVIAWSILQNIKSSGAPETTLLPPEISECMSSMTGMQGDLKGMAAH